MNRQPDRARTSIYPRRDLVERPVARLEDRDDLVESADRDDVAGRVGKIADAELPARIPAVLRNSKPHAEPRAVDVGHLLEVQDQCTVLGSNSGFERVLQLLGGAAVDAAAENRNRDFVLSFPCYPQCHVSLPPLFAPVLRAGRAVLDEPQFVPGKYASRTRLHGILGSGGNAWIRRVHAPYVGTRGRLVMARSARPVGTESPPGSSERLPSLTERSTAVPSAGCGRRFRRPRPGLLQSNTIRSNENGINRYHEGDGSLCRLFFGRNINGLRGTPYAAIRNCNWIRLR